MLSLRTHLVIALVVGTVISTVLLVLEPLTDFAFLWLEWPGISAAYVFQGAVGGSAVLGIAMSWVVNALTYGLGAFVILSAFKVLREA